MMFPSCDFAEHIRFLSDEPDECDLSEVGRSGRPLTPPRRENLQDFVSALKRKVRFAVAVGKVPQLTMIASELFLGSIAVSIEADPELEDKLYVVIHVEATGPIAAVAGRRKEWYNLTHKLLGAECELVQLSITVV
jgi:hypothetical protein